MQLTELGQNIRQERRRRKLTMQTLASRAGVDRTTLSRLENGRLPEMGYTKLQRVLAVLEQELTVQPTGALPTLDDLRRQQREERT